MLKRLWRRWRTRLTARQQALLLELAAGHILKGHRYIDGSKEFKMYDGPTELRTVSTADVEALQRRRLLDSNMKFPAAMFFLSEKGRRLARELGAKEV